MNGGYPVHRKPDLDNIIKIVKDALNDVVYVDDVQVIKVVSEWSYSSNPRLEVIIEEVKEMVA